MSVTPSVVAIALGSNVGDRDAYLTAARAEIAALDGITLVAETPVEETLAVDVPQSAFLNQMVLVHASGPLTALLPRLQAIETHHGRRRSQPKGPRTLDIDIVWAQDHTLTMAGLLVPHPGLLTRLFWQRELALLLGVDAASEAIATAQVHAGLPTSTYTGRS